MRVRLLAAVAASAIMAGGMTMASGATAKEAAASAPAIPQGTGPFARESTLPFHAPDFTKIKDADF